MLHFIDTGTDIQIVQYDPSGYLKELPVGIYEVSLTREMNPRFCLSKYEKTIHTPDKLYGEVTENVETIKRRYLNRPESLGVLLTGARPSGSHRAFGKVLKAQAKHSSLPFSLTIS